MAKMLGRRKCFHIDGIVATVLALDRVVLFSQIQCFLSPKIVLHDVGPLLQTRRSI